MPRIQNKPQAAVSPEFILTNKLIAEFRQLWVDQLKEAGVSHVQYSRLSIVALMQIAAVVAVDVGMQPKQLASLAVGSFEEALKKAPRFG